MISIPEEILEIMKKIGQTNNIYIVGGFVRDSIIGRKNDDFNLCTNMSIDRIKELFPSLKTIQDNDVDIGMLDVNGLDVAISVMKGSTLEEDFSKRDFTMNALACDQNGNIIDYFGGTNDLINRQISLVEKDGNGVDNDPIRILRALRFQGTHGFTLDSTTKEIINKKAELLKTIPPERVYSEFIRILCLDNPTNIIRENKKVFCAIIPGLRETIGFDQKNPHHVYDVFEHTLKVIENTPTANPDEKILRLAALFHDIGKPRTCKIDENGVGHFPEHNIVSMKAFEAFAKYFKIDKDITETVMKIIKEHDRKLSLEPDKINEFINEFGKEDLNLLFVMKEADMKAQNPDLLEERLQELEKIKQTYLELS